MKKIWSAAWIAIVITIPSCVLAQADTSTVSAIAPSSKIFLMPTANAIGGGNGFISDYELLFFYAGIGITDYVSITAGTSLIPGVPYSSQITTGQIKFTVAHDTNFAIALGANIGDITAYNTYKHVFANGSLLLDSAWYTAMIFYRAGGPTVGFVDARSFGTFTYTYSGVLGFALGAEIPIRDRPDMHFIAELWNADVGNFRSSAIFGGLNIRNDVVEGAFGLVFAPAPIVIPAANFCYHW